MRGNANLVPVVANGYVYVASYQTLTIFGLLPSQPPVTQSAASQKVSALATALATSRYRPTGPEIFGTVTSVTGEQIVVQLRSGASVTVDLTDAFKKSETGVPSVGEYVEVRGSIGPDGTLPATSMIRAKTPSTWGPDVQ